MVTELADIPVQYIEATTFFCKLFVKLSQNFYQFKITPDAEKLEFLYSG
ncbi:hypothetical protein B6N60_04704 [Richelia sinica FACHB-800]|uniref:Uncharacterized protein n=1 Tax=Richelia sinica FACHB-800 TaxID=1357546 RepID=A0A975TDA6_9NOST|nr:hypothetical protein B6N60_04704 [Richelia sinica FACHB-800]